MSPASQRNRVILGDCLEEMPRLKSQSVDFILTDPPYVTRYRSRDGETIRNDDNADWLEPAYAEMHRLLRYGGFAVSFYGWNRIDLFSAAWRKAGFRILGHIVFRKRYASSRGYLARHHESAYLLAKGRTDLPDWRIPDVIDFEYTGNLLHPTQKPVPALTPLVGSFCPQGGLVFDPFCGSGSSLVAAQQQGRAWMGMELDTVHYVTASTRLQNEMRDAA